MAQTIEENAIIILKGIVSQITDEMGRAMLSGEDLAHITDLLPAQINDAVSILLENGFVEWQQTLGTAPYIFREVGITPRGRYELERIEKTEDDMEQKQHSFQRAPQPIGSPYGFQFLSEHYQSDQLIKNLKEDFQEAVDQYIKMPGSIKTEFIFSPLSAGYGEHLFNEITRDIISADIAVFETSDLNSNVMIEMGVALTWGVRVLPIKKEKCPKPPSDISGQTWADYQNSGERFLDKDHCQKLLRMVERAIRKKGRV